MTVFLALLTLAAIFALACLAQALRTHGLAGVLDMLAAVLISLADSIRAGQAEYRRRLPENLSWAEARRR